MIRKVSRPEPEGAKLLGREPGDRRGVVARNRLARGRLGDVKSISV